MGRDLSEQILTYNPKTFLETIQLVNTLGGFKKAVNLNLATKQFNKPSYNNQYANQNSAKQKNG